MAANNKWSEPTVFSVNGQYFSNITTDGRLKIWECDSGLAKQEFIPASHLSASCTCLTWAPPFRQTEQVLRKKKKRKANGNSDGGEGLAGDVVALGTASGSVLLYSVTLAELQAELKGVHAGKIRSICWSYSGRTFFSQAADNKIVEWDVVKGTPLRQWKATKGFFKMAVLNDGETLVGAGRNIQCYNKDNDQVATFPGHANNVTQLVPVDCPGKTGYFVTSAIADRCISAWRFTGPNLTSAQSLVSFILKDDPVTFNVSKPSSADEAIILAAVTVSGLVQVFEHILNGRNTTPLRPKWIIHINNDSAIPRPLTLLAALPSGDSQGHMRIVYGSLLKPAFDNICLRECDSVTCLIRRDPLSSDSGAIRTAVVTDDQSSAMKTKTPIIAADVKTLCPGSTLSCSAADTPPELAAAVAQGRKRRPLLSESAPASGIDSLPMEQRLSALNLDKGGGAAGEGGAAVAPPQADNLAQLLLQGLHSRDARIVSSVLDRGDATVIANTVRRIPVQAVFTLVQELTRLMQYKANTNFSYAKWLRAVLECHAGYLTSCPDLQEMLTPLLSLMSARTALYPKVAQLRGRLELMLGELDARSGQKAESEAAAAAQMPAEALLVYQDESSDDASDDGDWPLQSGSESEDQWDDLSDIGEVMDAKDDIDDDAKDDTDDDQDIASGSDDDIVENGDGEASD